MYSRYFTNSVLENMTEMCFAPWLRFNFIRRLLGIYEPYNGSKAKIRQFIRKVNNFDILIHIFRYFLIQFSGVFFCSL